MLILKEQVSRLRDQDLFVQYFVEGRTLEEIAKARGWAVAKVQRAKEKLMKELGLTEEEAEGPSAPAPNE